MAETGQEMKGLLQEEGMKTDSHKAVLTCSLFPSEEKNITEDPAHPGSHVSAADTANHLKFEKKKKKKKK